jgi:hypothetical protein
MIDMPAIAGVGIHGAQTQENSASYREHCFLRSPDRPRLPPSQEEMAIGTGPRRLNTVKPLLEYCKAAGGWGTEGTAHSYREARFPLCPCQALPNKVLERLLASIFVWPSPT